MRKFPLFRMLRNRRAKGLTGRARLKKGILNQWFLPEIHETYTQPIFGIRTKR